MILQKAVPVLDDDTPDTLAARVFEAECEAYPEALRLIADGRVTRRRPPRAGAPNSAAPNACSQALARRCLLNNQFSRNRTPTRNAGPAIGRIQAG